MCRKILYFRILFAFCVVVMASTDTLQAQGIKGTITDADGGPVPFAAIYVVELHKGTTANEEGAFQLSLPAGRHEVRFQNMGYKTVVREFFIDEAYEVINLVMEMQEYMLPAVVVTATGEDPAYYIMRRAIGMSQYYLNQVSEYSCRVYLKGSGVIKQMPSLMRRQLEREGVEEGRYFVTETISDVFFELPDRIRTEVISLRSSGNDNESSPMSFVTISLYRDIDGIISPLSRSAMQVYRFELAGSFVENGYHINKIRVIPRRAGPDLYSGYVFIREDGWNLHSADLTVQQNMFTVNIRQQYNPVVEHVWMPVSQNFDMSFALMGFEVDYTYLVSVGDYEVTLNPDIDHAFYLDRMTERGLAAAFIRPVESEGLLPAGEQPAIGERQQPAAMSKRQQEIDELMNAVNLSNREMRRLNRLVRREARAARDKESLELFAFDMKIDDSARVRSREYWDLNRPVPLTQEELESFSEQETDSLYTEIDEEHNNRLWRQILTGGNHRFDENTTLEHNGIAGLSSFNYNTVDGFLFGKMVALNNQPPHGRYFRASADMKYAFARSRLMAESSLRYDYNPYRRAYIQASGGRTTSDFQGDLAVPAFANTLTTLFLKINYHKLYEKDFLKINHRLDIANGLVFYASAEYAQRKKLINNSFKFIANLTKNSFTPNFPDAENLFDWQVGNHNAMTTEFRLSYTHRHYYRMRGPRKVMVRSDYPTVSMAYRQGFDGFFESETRFKHAEASVWQTFDLRLIGRFSYHLAIGRFFNTENIYFADYKHFHTNPLWIKASSNTNMFFTLPFYSHSTTGDYAETHLHYNHSRLLIKRLPFLADKLLRERMFVKSLFVDGHKPYIEFGYGLDQVFLLFNIDLISGFSGGKHQYTGFRLGLPLSNTVSVGL